MKHNIFLIAALVGVGVVIGATLNSSDDVDSVRDVPDAGKNPVAKQQPLNPFLPGNKSRNSSSDERYMQLQQAVESLQARVDEEARKRRQLEQKIALLEDSVANGVTDNATTESQFREEDFETTESPHQFTNSSQETNWFNEQALMDAGVDPARISYIKDAFEQAEMEKLYLRDQATREGWMGTQRYREAAKEIADRTQTLQSELTNSEYDAYLYATGRANRVMVQSVLGGSPASNAGIQAGDTILQYGNKRIYSWSDLTTATSEGSADATVTVTIERDGQRQQVYVPRGPLGVRLSTDSVAP